MFDFTRDKKSCPMNRKRVELNLFNKLSANMHAAHQYVCFHQSLICHFTEYLDMLINLHRVQHGHQTLYISSSLKKTCRLPLLNPLFWNANCLCTNLGKDTELNLRLPFHNHFLLHLLSGQLSTPRWQNFKDVHRQYFNKAVKVKTIACTVSQAFLVLDFAVQLSLTTKALGLVCFPNHSSSSLWQNRIRASKGKKKTKKHFVPHKY